MLSGRKQLVFVLLSLAVTVGIFSYLLTTVSLQEVFDLIRSISWPWIALFLLFSLAMSIFRTWRYQLVLNVSGHDVPQVPLFLITLVRNLFSDLLPARLGTLVYVYLVRTRLRVPMGPVLSSFAHAFLFDMIALALLLPPAIAVASLGGRSVLVLLFSSAVIVLLSFAILLILPQLCQLFLRIMEGMRLLPSSWRASLTAVVRDTGRQLAAFRTSGSYGRVLALSLGVRSCKYASYYVLLVGLVLPLGFSVGDFPVAKVFLGLCSAELAASLPISGIAGFGAFEGAWSLVFQFLGYAEKIAVMTSISHHLFTQVYGYLLGAGALLLLLLPTFSRKRPSKTGSRPASPWWFWGRFAAFSIAVLMAAALLLPEGNAGAAQDSRAGTFVPGGTDIRGRVVYEHIGGIYFRELGSEQQVRLAPRGRYPRWSPDGRTVAFIDGQQVYLVDRSRRNAVVAAKGEKMQALAFGADGRWLLFSDGKGVQRLELSSGRMAPLGLKGDFRELDVDASGNLLSATEKTLTGYVVRVFDLKTGGELAVAKGCTAALSPSGERVTVLAGNHRKLFIHETRGGRRIAELAAPPGMKFDNHFWSNHPDWLVSTREGERKHILLHHLPSGAFRHIAGNGDSDRADLFVD